MISRLTQLVQEQTTASVSVTLARTIDRIAEQLASDLLNDPTFREEMKTLVRAAFARTLRELQEEGEP